MLTISKERLKKSLNKVLRLVARGSVVQVTSDSKVIARIVGIPQTPLRGLEGLIASGAISWSGGRKPVFDPVVLGNSNSNLSVSDIVIRDRG